MGEFIKSPSDTTLYKPALAKGRNSSELLNCITNFVENIRIETTSGQSSAHSMPIRREPACANRQQLNMDEQPQAQSPQPHNSGRDEQPRKLLTQAEKYKENWSAPKGNVDCDNDDDFFHVTCHIDKTLREKIERGEFIELEILLPKERNSYKAPDRLELISKDGQAYFAPAQDRNKITGIRTWEQAFRVYAAVYSKARPSQASEIWEYIYVINLAASSYSWENVAFYDHTFRKLMSEKPLRSWSKTYLQGWNLAMTDPISKHSKNETQSSSSGSNGKVKSWKDRCCWKYNKNRCNKGSGCEWDHRCTYCGGWNHSFTACRKRLKGKPEQQQKPGGNSSHNHSG